MNAEQYRKHFDLMETDPLVLELRRQLSVCKDIEAKAEIRFKIHERSIKFKQDLEEQATNNKKKRNSKKKDYQSSDNNHIAPVQSSVN
jgi:hypothetical protein